jgi:hypothetical protein
MLIARNPSRTGSLPTEFKKRLHATDALNHKDILNDLKGTFAPEAPVLSLPSKLYSLGDTTGHRRRLEYYGRPQGET